MLSLNPTLKHCHQSLLKATTRATPITWVDITIQVTDCGNDYGSWSVLPTNYKGDTILHEKAAAYMAAADTNCECCIGLTNKPDMCPDPHSNNNRGWDHVIRAERAKVPTRYTIVSDTNPDSPTVVKIIPHSPTDEFETHRSQAVMDNLITQVESLHNAVRNLEGEAGHMSCAGLMRRYSDMSVQFAAVNGGNTNERAADAQRVHSALFECIKTHRELFGSEYEAELESVAPFLRFHKKYFPSFNTSTNLTNASHLDFRDRCRSLAVFFTAVVSSSNSLQT